jgi:predicted dehydrogenase
MRILIVGAGAIAHHHAAAARKIPGAAILAADPSAEARARFAEAFPEALVFEEPEAMLREAPAGPSDIVVIAVPPWLHAPMSILAFGAGFHVLCEKPVARSVAELDTMLTAAADAGRMLGDCAVRFNGQPAMVEAREMIARGELGAINLVRLINRIPRLRPGLEYQPSSRWFLDREKAGGGVLMDWAVYDLAMLFDVLHPVSAHVRAAWIGSIDGRDDPIGIPVEVESHAVAMLELTLADGQRVPFLYERANGVNGPQLHEVSVEGRRGGVEWQWLPPYDDGMTKIIRHVDAGGKLDTLEEARPMGEHPHVHHQPLLAFAARIRGEPSVSLDEADIRLGLATIAAIYEAADGRTPSTIVRQCKS